MGCLVGYSWAVSHHHANIATELHYCHFLAAAALSGVSQACLWFLSDTTAVFESWWPLGSLQSPSNINGNK